MDFFFVILFLVVYYIRPQDWAPGLAGANLIKPIVALGLLSLLTKRRGLMPGNFLQTPHDWSILFYSAYIVFTAPDVTSTFTAMISMPVFYWLTVLALDSEEKILRYMKWWTGMLLALAGLGVASLYGIDPTGAVEQTESIEGRLSLGTWTHNNPNALGHSVVTAIPLAYFLMFWKSPMSSRILSVPLILLAAYAAWETQSKGAYLVGGGAIVLAFIFGKPKFVQVLVLTAVLVGGGTIMTMLPRMSQMNNLRADEGVMGRILAWEMARTTSKSHDYGVGWKQFQAYVEYEGAMYPKATHSSYVRIGAELGYPGLFFFIGILWCNLRVLMTLKTNHTDLERSRRMLFLLLATYVASGWMIDRSYHTEFFLLAACCGAIHRLQLQQKESLVVVGTTDEGTTPNLIETPPLPLEVSLNERQGSSLTLDPKPMPQKMLAWARLGLLDLSATAILTWATLYSWDYFLKNI